MAIPDEVNILVRRLTAFFEEIGPEEQTIIDDASAAIYNLVADGSLTLDAVVTALAEAEVPQLAIDIIAPLIMAAATL